MTLSPVARKNWLALFFLEFLMRDFASVISALEAAIRAATKGNRSAALRLLDLAISRLRSEGRHITDFSVRHRVENLITDAAGCRRSGDTGRALALLSDAIEFFPVGGDVDA